MSTPQQRVLQMQLGGTLKDSEAQELLNALKPRPRHPLWLLIDPFERFGGGPAALVGLAVSLVGLLTSRLNIRYDGFLDMHIGQAPVPWTTALVDQLVAFPLSAALLWLGAKLIARQGRFIDALGVVGLSRIPSLTMGLLAIVLLPFGQLSPQQITSLRPVQWAGLAAFVAVAIAGIVWQITLLCFGFRNASGLRGAKLAGTFIVTLVLTEVLSKVALGLIL